MKSIIKTSNSLDIIIYIASSATLVIASKLVTLGNKMNSQPAKSNL